MSEEWLFYPCQMGGHQAFIFYDHGIRDTINQTAPPHLLKVRVAFKTPRPDGLSSQEEFERLCALEDGLEAVVKKHGGIYVGRITAAGHRYFHIFTSDTDDMWSADLVALGNEHGYPLQFALKSDEGKDGYWRDLFPSDDDWQVIMDLRLLEVLDKQGDDGATSRRIEHWAYFPSPTGAEQFVQWARDQQYDVSGTDARDNGKHCVRFSHNGTCQLSEITAHTVALRRKASELGGDYDGWETPVCKPRP
jgi:hypothetical protein